MLFVSLSDGRVLCERNGRGLFSPASVQKVITTAAALEKLGPKYTFVTSVYSGQAISNGFLAGDLVIYGRGAPDLDQESLVELALSLKKKGLTKISGDIIGDSSYFRADDLGDGWTWNEAQWYYGASASALSYERNIVTITISNGKPKASSAFVDLSGEIKPVERIDAIGVKRRLGTNEVFVWGNGKNLKARIAVDNPALFTARVFKEVLEQNGIRVEGGARSADWTKPTGAEKAVELGSITSVPLAEIIRTMNKDSVNLHAELILRTLGKRFGSEAPDSDPKMNKLRGDDLAGAAVVTKLLRDNGIETGQIAIHDGSGLSRLGRMTPESILRTIILAAKSAHSKVFTDSLPVAGKNGTLRARLKKVAGLVIAKTGSIKYSNSLAGFAIHGNESVAFVIICNDETNREDSTATIDAIISNIASREVQN